MTHYNFHTHTKRCGHAVGEDEEYIEAAIKNGYQVLGISDHCPYRELSVPKQRMEWHQYLSYIATFQQLKEKYKKQLELYIGFECECYENHLEQLRELRSQCDYLILGQHHYLKDGGTYTYQTPNQLDQLLKDAEVGMQEHLFLYMAHPDHYLRERQIWDEAAIKTAHAICKLSLQYDIPLELNYNGMYRQKTQQEKIYYPYSKFWEIVGSYGCNVCIGMDIHNPDRFYHQEYLKDIQKIIDDYHLHTLSADDLVARIRK